MMRRLPTAYFDALYSGSEDPWQMATSPYEASKYAATLAALPRQRYSHGLEVGCAIGVLSAGLADRCDELVAVDVAAAALAAARRHNRDRGNICFVQAAFPDDLPVRPAAGFDLIILSEVLYYFAAEALADVAAACCAIAAPAADLLLVHWLGPTPDYPLTGESASNAFIGMFPETVQRLHHARTSDYRLDLLRL